MKKLQKFDDNKSLNFQQLIFGSLFKGLYNFFFQIDGLTDT